MGILRYVIAAAVALLLLLIFVVPPSAAHVHSSAPERYYAHRCGEQSTAAIKACIHRAALHWGANVHDGYYIASRETGHRDSNSFDPNICNTEGSGACGLFQFKTPLWSSTPYHARSRFSAKYASLAWAWAWTHGYRSHWG